MADTRSGQGPPRHPEEASLPRSSGAARRYRLAAGREEKARLEAVLAGLQGEVGQLEVQLQQETEKMQKNNLIIATTSQTLAEVASKVKQ